MCVCVCVCVCVQMPHKNYHNIYGVPSSPTYFSYFRFVEQIQQFFHPHHVNCKEYISTSIFHIPNLLTINTTNYTLC